MSERFHDDPSTDALGQQERRAAMAQIMESLTWQSRPFDYSGELSANVTRVERAADSRREDEVTVVPC
jgi:hypothetical protein